MRELFCLSCSGSLGFPEYVGSNFGLRHVGAIGGLLRSRDVGFGPTFVVCQTMSLLPLALGCLVSFEYAL
jgi:hypothetical protein